MTHNEAQAVADRIAQALPGHHVEVVTEEVTTDRGPCYPSTWGAAIRVDEFYLLSSVDPLASVRAIFGVEV